MALVIQSFAAQARGNHLGSRAGAPLTGAVPRVDLAQRDKQGVYALSLVAEGESRLQAFLRQAEEQGGISGREEAFFTSAQEEMRKIVEKSQGEETGKVVARQLQGSLEAFRIRSQDLRFVSIYHTAKPKYGNGVTMWPPQWLALRKPPVPPLPPNCARKRYTRCIARLRPCARRKRRWHVHRAATWAAYLLPRNQRPPRKYLSVIRRVW